MDGMEKRGDALLWKGKNEILQFEHWGENTIRVRGATGGKMPDDAFPGALVTPATAKTETTTSKDKTIFRVGSLALEIATSKDFANPDIPPQLRFIDADSGRELLEETPSDYPRPPARSYKPLENDDGLLAIEATFSARGEERFYGLGQHQHGLMDQKGAVIDLVQYNSEISIPFLLSSAGYGFLWNNPALGRVELAANHTRWTADAAWNLDYLVFGGGNPAEILKAYMNATGLPRRLPDWALGFWQSKLRYGNQEELLDVAREYKRRGLPLSVIVIDYFNWSKQGDWRFDPRKWPNPTAMVRELREMGIETMVSTWPTVNPESENFEEMEKKDLLLKTKKGLNTLLPFREVGQDDEVVNMHYYDSTNPEARKFIWDKVEKGYGKHGIKAFWLDACEPEISPRSPETLRFHLGDGKAVANIYPFLHQQAFHEGARSLGKKDLLLLSRSAWAGSQRFPVAVWSGDIASTFDALRAQIRAGLNMALSGIPWWTTDIGGFHGGDPNSPAFQELIVRWFQYAAFSPLFRLHGFRLPNDRFWDTGGPNEPWSFGECAYEIIKKLLFLRENLRPYLLELAEECSKNGAPPMRPLLLQFPHDETSWNIDDQFLLGPDILVSPILFENATSRKLYLPNGAEWIDARTGEQMEGGQFISAEAPIDTIPIHVKADAKQSIIECLRL